MSKNKAEIRPNIYLIWSVPNSILSSPVQRSLIRVKYESHIHFLLGFKIVPTIRVLITSIVIHRVTYTRRKYSILLKFFVLDVLWQGYFPIQILSSIVF